MLIQLRQNEIEEAVKMYVEAQGINLTGKKVDMNFTSGRGNNGLTVDLDIVDAKLSELTSGAQQPRALAPVSELTSGDTKGPELKAEQAPENAPEPIEPDADPVAEEPAPVAAGASLFG